jgi:hypothetical protein
MKLFEIRPNTGYAPIGSNPEILRGYPRAWADVTTLSLHDKEDLAKIGKKEPVIRDTPFHCFRTEYWDDIEKEAYEWTLLDIYPGASNDYDQYGILVSEKAKMLLEQYILEEDPAGNGYVVVFYCQTAIKNNITRYAMFVTSLFCQAVSRQAKQHKIIETLQG